MAGWLTHNNDIYDSDLAFNLILILLCSFKLSFNIACCKSLLRVCTSDAQQDETRITQMSWRYLSKIDSWFQQQTERCGFLPFQTLGVGDRTSVSVLTFRRADHNIHFAPDY